MIFPLTLIYNEIMPATLPIELYDLLEKKVGKEEAREVGRIIMASFDAIERRAETVVVQKKAEIKEELTKELVTKEDLAKFEGRLNERVTAVELTAKEDVAKLEGKLTAVEGRLSERITNVEGKLNERISSLEGRLNEKIAAVEGRLNEKIAAVEGQLSERIASLEGRMNERFTTMDWKMRVYFLILLFTILLTNPKALDLIAKLFGLVK